MNNEDTAVGFAQHVWEVLSKTDVTNRIEKIEATAKRPEVAYLSWANAWSLLKDRFPGSTYSHRQDIIHPDNTVEVEVDVIIQGSGPETQFTNARLGVMDFYFGPIANPTARQVNDARQRCLVKALAFAGLGLNLWLDSELPVGKLDDPVSPEEAAELTALIEETNSDIDNFVEWAGVAEIEDMQYEKYVTGKAMLEARKRRLEKEAKEAKDADSS
jgi:hypothetical protein